MHCVVLYSCDNSGGSIEMLAALQTQNLLAYGMNERGLPIPHGARLRLRSESQLGYQSIKFLARIVDTDTLEYGSDKGIIQAG